MHFLFILGAISSLFIFLFTIKYLIKSYRSNSNYESNLYSKLFFVSLCYMLIFILYFSWLNDFLIYNSIEFIFIFSVVLLIQTVTLFNIVYNMGGKKALFLWLSFYLASLFSIFISLNLLPVFIILISFFLTIII